MNSFAENLTTLPGVNHLLALHLFDDKGNLTAVIENVPGSQGSLAIYNHLAQSFGAITPEAAEHGLQLYAEHVDDARLHPGKHPNIDRLLLLTSDGVAFQVKQVMACW